MDSDSITSPPLSEIWGSDDAVPLHVHPPVSVKQLLQSSVPTLDPKSVENIPEEHEAAEPVIVVERFSDTFKQTMHDMKREKHITQKSRRESFSLRRRTSDPTMSPGHNSNSSSSDDDTQKIHSLNPRATLPMVRSQHALSHQRAERLQRRKQRTSKTEGGVRRPKSSDKATENETDSAKPAPTLESSSYTRSLESAVRREAYQLDGEPGWALPPPQRRSSDSFVFGVKSMADDRSNVPTAGFVDWHTLRLAREKCTEWLVKHVVLPEQPLIARNTHSAHHPLRSVKLKNEKGRF